MTGQHTTPPTEPSASDAEIVFTGGVGENADEIRVAICEGLGVIGVAAPD